VGEILTFEEIFKETQPMEEIRQSEDDCERQENGREVEREKEKESEREKEKGVEREKERERESSDDQEKESSGEPELENVVEDELLEDSSSGESQEEESEEHDKASDAERVTESERQGEEEYEKEGLNWRVETQAMHEELESETIPILAEESGTIHELFQAYFPLHTESVVEKMYRTPWTTVVDLVLTELIERHTGKLTREELILLRAPLDQYWSGALTLTRIGLMATSDYLFWHDLIKDNIRMELIASLAAALVSCPASEAQCERGFSFLHYIMRRERNRLSLRKIYESMAIKED
jgi:hypothetical protein